MEEERPIDDDDPETRVGDLESFLSNWREDIRHKSNVLDHTNKGEVLFNYPHNCGQYVLI